MAAPPGVVGGSSCRQWQQQPSMALSLHFALQLYHACVQAATEVEWDEAALRRLFKESLPAWVSKCRICRVASSVPFALSSNHLLCTIASIPGCCTLPAAAE